MNKYLITHFGKWNGNGVEAWQECEIHTDCVDDERQRIKTEIGRDVALIYEQTPETPIKNRRKWHVKLQ